MAFFFIVNFTVSEQSENFRDEQISIRFTYNGRKVAIAHIWPGGHSISPQSSIEVGSDLDRYITVVAKAARLFCFDEDSRRLLEKGLHP